MSDALYQFVSIDLPPMLTGMLAAVSCALLGNYLVLRRLSLMGDAISHAVLPGLVAGFLLSGSRSPAAMLLGAGAAGAATVALVGLVRRLCRLESGAAMGVVFSVLFALGVLLIEQSHARGVDLDADCVLNGELSLVYWLPPRDPSLWLRAETLALLPRQLVTLAAVTLIVGALVALFFKELRLVAFDPALATALGFRAGLFHAVLMVLVAAVVVASFEAVGSILVIAMLVCPPATARLCTDSFRAQIVLSAVFAAVAGAGGYLLASRAPGVFGTPTALNPAGMISVVAAFLFVGAALCSPSHGVIAARLRRLRLGAAVAREDLLAALFRAEELSPSSTAALPARALRRIVGGRLTARLALRTALAQRDARRDSAGVALTDSGRRRARGIVRSHRLWESFLAAELGLPPDHVHAPAERLEHVTSEEMQRRLATDAGPRDPHDRPIPAR